MLRHLRKYRNSVLSAQATLLLLALSFAPTGCSDSKPSAPAPSTAPSAVVPSAAQPRSLITGTTGTVTAQATRPEEVYTYRAAGRRDPFAPIISKQEKKAAQGDRPPLERYNLSEFKLSGIVWGGFGYNAMIEGPDGKGYFIRVGTIIGPNAGVVKRITSSSIVIEEKHKNLAGETERKEIVVELRKKQEGKL